MTQGDKETFKEYAQRFIQKSAQVHPALDEREVTDLFFETLSPFYSEKMFVVATQKFNDIMDTGMRIEDWVRKGRFPKEGSSTCCQYPTTYPSSTNAKLPATKATTILSTIIPTTIPTKSATILLTTLSPSTTSTTTTSSSSPSTTKSPSQNLFSSYTNVI